MRISLVNNGITYPLAGQSGVPEGTHSSAGDFQISGDISQQTERRVRATEAETYDRGNLLTTIRFSTVRTFGSAGAAEVWSLGHDAATPRTGTLQFTATSGEPWEDFTMANAVVAPPARRVMGCAVLLSYQAVGGVPTSPVHPLALAYQATLQAAGTTPAPAGIWRMSLALDALAAAALLDDLVDGACYSADVQPAAGVPYSLRGVAATEATGTIARRADGLYLDQADAQTITHPLASVPLGTAALDVAYDHAAPQTYHYTLQIRSADDTNRPIQFYSQSGGVLKLAAMNDGSLAGAISGDVSNGIESRMVWMRNKDCHRIVATFGSGTSALWVDGCLSTPTGSWEYTTGDPTSRITLGGTAGFQSQGTFSGWLVFSRKLNEAEAQTVNRALAIMDSRPVNVIVEGDSTVEALYDLDRYGDHWPMKLREETGWDAARIVNLGSSGHSVGTMISQWDVQCSHNIVPGKRNLFIAAGGINDIIAGHTAAQTYTDLLSLLALAAAAGCETALVNLAVPAAGGLWTAGMTTIANDLNDLIAAGHIAGDFDFLIDAAAEIPSHTAPYDTLWHDNIHPNGAGNALIAAAVAAAIPL